VNIQSVLLDTHLPVNFEEFELLVDSSFLNYSLQPDLNFLRKFE